MFEFRSGSVETAFRAVSTARPAAERARADVHAYYRTGECYGFLLNSWENDDSKVQARLTTLESSERVGDRRDDHATHPQRLVNGWIPLLLSVTTSWAKCWWLWQHG